MFGDRYRGAHFAAEIGPSEQRAMAQSNAGTTSAEISKNCTPNFDAQTPASFPPPGATTCDVSMSQPALAGKTRARSALNSSGQSPQRKIAASVQPPAQGTMETPPGATHTPPGATTLDVHMNTPAIAGGTRARSESISSEPAPHAKKTPAAPPTHAALGQPPGATPKQLKHSDKMALAAAAIATAATATTAKSKGGGRGR